MDKSDKLLNTIAKSIPLGTKYYIMKDRLSKVTNTISPMQIAGPWDLKEITKKFKKLNDKDSYIATWDGKTWNKISIE